MSEYIVNVPDKDAELFIARFGIDGTTMFGYNMTGEIVRCRDCRHMRTIDLSVYYGEHKHDLDICTRVDGVQLNVEPDGFCKWGERRGA